MSARYGQQLPLPPRGKRPEIPTTLSIIALSLSVSGPFALGCIATVFHAVSVADGSRPQIQISTFEIQVLKLTPRIVAR